MSHLIEHEVCPSCLRVRETNFLGIWQPWVNRKPGEDTKGYEILPCEMCQRIAEQRKKKQSTAAT